MPPLVKIAPSKKENPIVTAIIPGRRALGEQYRKVTIYPDPDTGTYLIENEETEPVAKPIIIPALGNISIDMADWMLEHARDRQPEKLRAQGQQSEQERFEKVNTLWHEYLNQKREWLLGRTHSGPSGWTQRERRI